MREKYKIQDGWGMSRAVEGDSEIQNIPHSNSQNQIFKTKLYNNGNAHAMAHIYQTSSKFSLSYFFSSHTTCCPSLPPSLSTSFGLVYLYIVAFAAGHWEGLGSSNGGKQVYWWIWWGKECGNVYLDIGCDYWVEVSGRHTRLGMVMNVLHGANLTALWEGCNFMFSFGLVSSWDFGWHVSTNQTQKINNLRIHRVQKSPASLCNCIVFWIIHQCVANA